jgi:hypothetical protein
VAHSLPLRPRSRLLIKFFITQQFSFFISNYLTSNGISCTSVGIKELEHCVQSNFMHKTIQSMGEFQLFLLDTNAKLETFQNMIGEMSIVGIRTPRPRLHTDFQISVNTSLNIANKLSFI